MNLNNINFLIKIVVILSRNINKSATSYNPSGKVVVPLNASDSFIVKLVES